MSDYCDIIRTQGSDATMSIEVLRFSTEEVYEGQLNGTPLVLSFSFAQEFEDEIATEDPAVAADTYTEYMSISDDSGSITTDVPVEWVEIDGTPDPDFGPSLHAAPSLEGFFTTWSTPGVAIDATAFLDANSIDAELDARSLAEYCTYDGRTPYSDPLYTGSLDTWSNCGGVGAFYFVVAVTPADGSYLAVVEIQAVEPRDLDAADQILATFIASP
jgi:serine protease Do